MKLRALKLVLSPVASTPPDMEASNSVKELSFSTRDVDWDARCTTIPVGPVTLASGVSVLTGAPGKDDISEADNGSPFVAVV